MLKLEISEVGLTTKLKTVLCISLVRKVVNYDIFTASLRIFIAARSVGGIKI